MRWEQILEDVSFEGLTFVVFMPHQVGASLERFHGEEGLRWAMEAEEIAATFAAGAQAGDEMHALMRDTREGGNAGFWRGRRCAACGS